MRSLFSSRPAIRFEEVRAWLASAGLLPGRLGAARRDGLLAQEFQRAVELSLRLARTSGRLVCLTPRPGPGRISPRLPREIAWGKPEHVPLPACALDPRWAREPRTLMVSPWHTATEGMWFLRYRGLSYCLRLTARGCAQVLRFEKRSGWQEA